MKTTSLVAQAAALFGAAPESCQPIRGGNFSKTYTFERDGLPRVLRISPPDPDASEEALAATLAFIDYLAQGGVSVPAPLRSCNGRLIEPVQAEGERHLAMAFEKAPGILGEELSFEVWNPARYAHLGRSVGRMHARAAAYRPASHALERPHWHQSGNCFNQDASALEDALLQRRQQAVAAVQDFPRHPAGYGLIHADLHGGNFLFDLERERITILDFDDCVYGWYAMDIAMSVLDFCVLTPQAEKEDFAAAFLRSYLSGYLPEFPLAPQWIERLPAFLKLLETGLYAMCAPFNTSDEPDSWPARFMAGRKERILANQPFLALDFTSLFPPFS